MYDRCIRNCVQINTSTGPLVGPNTYYIEVDDSCKCKLNNAAPFLTTSSRIPPVGHQTTPSPNAYYPTVRNRILGGSSMRNKDRRFKYPVTPEKDVVEDEDSDVKILEEPIGYLYKCKVPFNLHASVPSFPPKNHCGYEEINSVLKPLKKCDYIPETSVIGKLSAGNLYRGCKWSKSKSERISTAGINKNPGPGAYDLEPPQNINVIKGEKVKEMKRREACLPRYLDMLQAALMKENSPGPADYTIERKVKKGPFGFRKKAKNVQKFQSTAKRFTEVQNVTPAPNEYVDPRTALDVLRRTSCVQTRSAFLTSSVRFKDKCTDNPAPNHYDIKSSFSKCKAPSGGVKECGFNSSQERETFPLPRDVWCTPSPATFSPKLLCTTNNMSRASFKSMSVRENVCEPYRASCALYDVRPCLKRLNGPCCKRRCKQYTFNTTCRRFGRITDMKSPYIDMDIPGPGIYNLSDYKPGKNSNVGRLPDHAGRSMKFSDTPGPGTYTVHPLYSSSVLKRTFNRTLNNPIPRYSEPGDWKKKLAPRKILKPFLEKYLTGEDEQEEYRKQIMDVAALLDEKLV